MRRRSLSCASLALPGLCLVGAWAACSFDANRLRALPDGAIAPADAVISDSGSDAALVPDIPAPDALVEMGGREAPAATGGAGGNDGAIEVATTKRDDALAVGADGRDVPLATGGSGAGGTAGTIDAAGSLGGTNGGSGGVGSGGAGGISGTGGGGDDGGSSTGGNTGSGGQTNAGGFGGSTVVGTGGAAGSGGNSSGGQTSIGSGGIASAVDAAVMGGSGGVVGTVDAASDGTACTASCPLIATVGITGPWNATYTNGTTGDVVRTGDTTFLAWLAARSASCAVDNLAFNNNSYLTAAQIAPYKVIMVLDIYHTQADKDALFKTKRTNPGFPTYNGNQRAPTSSEVNAIRDWVNAGGGLMVTIGITSTAAEMANANILLRPFGIAYSTTDVNVLQGNSSVSVFSVAPPIASQITAGVGTLPVTGAAGIEGLSGGNLPPNSSTFSMYGTGGGSFSRGGYVGGYSIGVAKINGAGRINLWGDEWITYDDAWTGAHAADVRSYWNNVITWLGQCP